MNQRFLGLIGAVVCAALAISGAQAAGNLAAKPTQLKLATDTGKLTFSQNKFELETGKYYELTVSSDGQDEIILKSPDLWQNSWIDYAEIKTPSSDVDLYDLGPSLQIGFDDAGEANIFFVPLRPGNYQFYADGFQDRGLSVTFTVR